MSMPYHRIAGQFFNRPLLLTPSSASTIADVLCARMRDGSPALRGGGGGADDARDERTFFAGKQNGDGSVTVHSPAASRFYGETPLSEDGTRRPLPFRRTAEGVAIITLVGEWVNRGGYVGASSGVISYEGFSYQLDQAARDPRTKAVLLDMESPGGEAVGAFEAAAAVRALAAVKPVTALVNGLCASAAYAIASGASRIVSIPTGITGSIGVVLAHFDYSGFLKEEGIKPTFIHAGARKVDANPYQPLPASVRERLQSEVETFYDLFVTTVAEGRAGLTDKAIRATEAGCFMGAEALELGLVDELGTFEAVLAQLGGAPGSHRPTTTVAAKNRSTTTVTENDEKAVRADERARVKQITSAPEARGREKQALALALSTSLTVTEATEILAASPKQVDHGAAFIAMQEGRTELNLDPDASPSASAAFSWDEIVASLNAEQGFTGAFEGSK